MKSIRGYILILLATLFWGASAVIARLLFDEQIKPLVLVQMRVMFSFVLMGGFYLIVKREYLKVAFADLPRLALFGVIAVAGSNFTYYYTIQQINVSTAILIQYTAPLLVVAYAALSKEESTSPLKIGAAVVSLTGCYFAVGGTQMSLPQLNLKGLVSGIGSALCWAFANIYLRRLLRRYRVWTILIYAFFFSTIFWFFFIPPWEIIGTGYAGTKWTTFIGFAMISVLIPHSLYFLGVRYISASRAIITGTFEPIVAIAGSFIILGDLMTPLQLLGAALVVIAISLLQMKREEGEIIEG